METRETILNFPSRRVSIHRGTCGICTATLFKDLRKETINGKEQLTADTETIDIHYFEDLQDELEGNFEASFERARLMGLQKAKDEAYAKIKAQVDQSDYKCFKHADGAVSDELYEPIKEERAALRAKYSEVEKATTRERLAKIVI